MSSPDRRRLVLYVVAPALVVGGCVALYFSGVPWMQTLASPRWQRELGLVENIQNALLIGIAVLCWRAARGERTARARIGWRGVALLALFLLLEEIDYGDHFWRALRGMPGRPPDETPINLHNRGNLTTVLKRGTDLVFTLWFGLLPFLSSRLPRSWRPWLASRWSLLTLLTGVGLSSLAHRLDDAGVAQNGALRGNISEFREMTTYWVLALYLGELWRRRRGPVP